MIIRQKKDARIKEQCLVPVFWKPKFDSVWLFSEQLLRIFIFDNRGIKFILPFKLYGIIDKMQLSYSRYIVRIHCISIVQSIVFTRWETLREMNYLTILKLVSKGLTTWLPPAYFRPVLWLLFPNAFSENYVIDDSSM